MFSKLMTVMGLVVILLASGANALAQKTDASPVPADAGGPIKVGVTLSKLTATTKSPGGKPWGYDGQTRIVAAIASPEFELYPVIEPNTADDPDLKVQLDKLFAGKKPIDGSDPEALKKIDVLVAHEDWMLPAPMLDGVEKAVSAGLGLLNIGGMGWASPGIYTLGPTTQPVATQVGGSNQVPSTQPAGPHNASRLTGMIASAGGYVEGGGTLACKIVSDHSILQKFSTTADIDLPHLGMYGVLPPDATPLVRADDSSSIKPRGPHGDTSRFVSYPIYLSHLEKGRIVGISFSPFKLRGAAQRQVLLRRSIRWLAGRLQNTGDGGWGL